MEPERAACQHSPRREALRSALELALVLTGLELSRHAAVQLREACGVAYDSHWSQLVWSLWTAILWSCLVLAFAHVRGERLAHLGLRRPARGWPRAIALGGVTGVSIWVLLRVLAVSLHRGLELGNHGGVFAYAAPADVLRLLTSTTLLGGFAEELVFRGLLLDRIERLLAPWLHPWTALALAVAGSSAVFAFGHREQGALALPVTFVVGCAMCVAYLRFGRELPQVMIAHALVDALEVLYAHSLG